MRRSNFLPLFVVLALAGCDQFRANERMALAILGPQCPVPAVLGEAVTVTKVRPGTPMTGMPDAANVVFTAEMSKPQLECEYDAKRTKLVVDVNFAVRATRGAAAAMADPPIDFFVAVVDVDNNVLVKKVYQAPSDLRGKKTGQWTQNVRNFAVPIEADRRPQDYEILTGFQLTPAELAYNRAPKPVQLRRP